MIDAETARADSESNRIKNIENVLNIFENAIKDAVKRGENYCFVDEATLHRIAGQFISLKDFIPTLKNYGYSAEIRATDYNEVSIYISW